ASQQGLSHAAFWTDPSPRTACVTAQAVWNTLATAPDQGDGFIMHKGDEWRQSFCSEYFYSLHFCLFVRQSLLTLQPGQYLEGCTNPCFVR
ncbi:hypothetical protein ABFV62_28885, partial [Pseudomonas syringae]|uniref:hypothetical protein n=1 Tax=Pseudomonas syringae TaxID=317 RepID=UPI0034D64449